MNPFPDVHVRSIVGAIIVGAIIVSPNAIRTYFNIVKPTNIYRLKELIVLL